MFDDDEYTERQFKQRFITTFLATHAAVNYQRNIDHGEHDASINIGMVEEAETLADMVWDNV